MSPQPVPPKTILFSILIIFLIVIAVACGGGGDGGNPVYYDPNQLFKLEESGYYEPGHKEVFSITGYDTDGGQFTGSFRISTKSKVILDQEIVTPIESLFNLTNTVRGISISSISTTYYDSNEDPVKMVISDPDVEYTPVKIANYPDKARIDDFGPSTTWEGNDGSVMTGTWVLENAPGGKAYFVSTGTMKDSSGKVMGYDEITLTINEDGYASYVSVTIHSVEEDITLNLSGKRVS